MASTPEQKSEGTIASRLRSSSKKTPQTKEGVEGKPSRLEKDGNKIKTEKVIMKRTSDNKPSSSNQQAIQKPIKQQPTHYIRWEGIEDTSMQWNCDLCKLDLAKEEQGHPTQPGDQLQYFLLSSQGREDDGTVFPEVTVLPCSHVFHVTCLSASLLAHVTDPSCPICDRVTTPLGSIGSIFTIEH